MFERLLYDVMLAFFSENNLFSPNLSRFRSSDSCINQLLSITHEILNAFNKGLEVCGIIFDISKTSDNVWHNGLLFKFRQNGISGDIIDILEDFLRNRKQRVVWTVSVLLGLIFVLMFLKGQFLNPYCS